MTPRLAHAASSPPGAGGLLGVGVILAVLTEAFTGTILVLGRSGIMGDLAATPDEFAWLDIAYTGFKMMAFMAAPWLIARTSSQDLLLVATAIIGLASALAAFCPSLGILVALRVPQGFSGGILLVAGQALLFTSYSRARQPLAQAFFAMGSVVVPATIGLATQGWLLDSQSWRWISFGSGTIGAVAVGVLVLVERQPAASPQATHFDLPGFTLISASLMCITYICVQGSRWNWFDEHRIVCLSALACLTLFAFVMQQSVSHGPRLLDLSVFRVDDFLFAFLVSFVAGAALYGSAYLIPAFAVSVLAFTPGAAGRLLLPSGALFAGALLTAAYLMQARRKPPILTVPLGIVLLMIAMWLLSGSTNESGADDMMLAILLRGAGLGFLFLSITIIAFNSLPDPSVSSGIGLFNLGRQLGGLIGVSALQTLIGHHIAQAQTVLAAHLTAGTPSALARLEAIKTMLISRGLEADVSNRVAMQLLGRSVSSQSAAIAFNDAFLTVAMLFVFAAPVLVAIKILLARLGTERRHAEHRLRRTSQASKTLL